MLVSSNTFEISLNGGKHHETSRSAKSASEKKQEFLQLRLKIMYLKRHRQRLVQTNKMLGLESGPRRLDMLLQTVVSNLN